MPCIAAGRRKARFGLPGKTLLTRHLRGKSGLAAAPASVLAGAAKSGAAMRNQMFVAAIIAGGLVAPQIVLAQGDPVQALLKELSEAPGPSGFEEPVRKIMVREMKPLADQLSYDGMGSVIARQGSAGPRIMIDAHMDEVGGMVRHVTADGFLSMQTLGGVLDQALPDQRWVIIGSKGPVTAVTGIRDIHGMPPADREKVIPAESIYLDIGARSAAEVAAMGIEPGDPVAPDTPFAVLNGTKRYAGKAWDDRAGCAVLIEAMRRLKASSHPNQIFFAATTQEEIGLRGGHTATEVVKPDIGIAIEGGVTSDSPGRTPFDSQVKLGAGPGLFFYDPSALPNRRLVAMIRDTAKAGSIPLQFDLVRGYGEDSAEIQESTGGVPTVNLVVPARYTHAHNGVMDRADFDGMVDLMVALVQKLDARTVAHLRDFTPEP
jgi:putative aminopeptidase FrvX